MPSARDGLALVLALVAVVSFDASRAAGSLDLGDAVVGSPPPPNREMQTTVWFQGYVTDPSTGEPVNASHSVVARIYDAEVGGATVWGPETHGATLINDGWFSIELGSVVSPLPAFDQAPYYLQLWIGGEMLEPRLKLASVPSALRSVTVESWVDLPYSASYSGAGAAFSITTQGTGNCANFTIDNVASTADAVYGYHSGPGSAVVGWASGDGEGVRGVSNGSGPAVYGVAYSDGYAGEFDGPVRITDTLRVEGLVYGDAAAFENAAVVGGTLATQSFMMPTGATAGYVLTCDDSWGNASWQPVGFSLPYSGTVSSADPTAALSITQTGSGAAFKGVGSGDRTAVFEGSCNDYGTQVVSAEYVGPASYEDVAAVRGKSVSGDGYGFGGLFHGGWRGVVGEVSGDATASRQGVLGAVYGGSSHNTGVYGSAHNSTDTNTGVYGVASGLGATNYAGYFEGDTEVTGFLYKTGGGFKIDHPLDPENSYLYHSFVESPDMMNIYNGNVTLDSDGRATIELPDWFEAVNRGFRYQLTAIGAPGPNLHIAEKISSGRFRIAGGEPGMEVSWQVTGIRHDPAADHQRIPVVQEKPPDERGKYRIPEVYGKPREMGVGYIDEERERVEGS